MKTVRAYADNAGGLHPSKAKAAEAEILNITAPVEGLGMPPAPMPPGYAPSITADKIVAHRKKILAVLQWVDQAENGDEVI
jgi:hypothetical protein